MILALLFAATSLAASPAVRPLSANSSIRDSLAGGEKAIFAIDVPAESAARIVVRQEGVDVGITLRLAGSDLPEHGLDMTAGPTGEETRFVPISDAPAAWNVFVAPSIPQARRGDYTISLQIAPADDHARAVAAARQAYQQASDTARLGDGKAFQTAVAAYAAVAEAATAAGDKSLAAEATYQCARVHDNLGETPEAIEWQRRALVMFRELGRRDREARVLNRLGDLSRKVGEVAESQRFFEEALPIAREAGDAANVADILNNSGLLMSAMGRWEEALEQLENAIPLAKETGAGSVETALWFNIGDAYLRLGVADKAIEGYQRALEVGGRSNLPLRRKARSFLALAAAYYESGDRAKADESIRLSLDLFEKSADKAGTAEALGFAALMQHANGETERALESFARAVPLLHEAHSRAGEARVLRAWAQVEIDRGATDDALQKLDGALTLSRAIADRSGEAKGLYLRALALQKKDRLGEAIDAIAQAIEIIESMRGAIVRSELRSSYLAAVRRYYDLHIDLLQARGQSSAAFSVSERARARSLLEALAQSASKIRKGVDPDLLKRERAMQSALNAKEIYRAQVVLKDGEKSPRAVALAGEVERLLEGWRDLEKKIRTSSPSYSALQMPQPIGIERAQKSLLDTGSALIEYHLGTWRSYAWVIDRRSITVHELPAAAAIDKLARRYHELLSRETETLTAAERAKLSKDVAAAGRSVAAAVWKPLAKRVSGKRLLIVADGSLQYVPFAALPVPEPLITQHEIVYLPSASVLDTIRHSKRRAVGSMIAVFADPVFSASDPRISGSKAASVPPPSISRSDPYQRLRFSRKEAEAIVALSSAHGTFQALDFSAAKKTLSDADLRKFRILHFATHGSLNTEKPDLSGLVFSLVDANGKAIDGYLRLHEIYNLDLDADLVVLSACQTALGKEVFGEGLIGLTRGFMYAGASRVVSSVWNVDDRASALLMSRFYSAMLAKRMAPAAALREAQLSLLREARWSNPHDWAAFGLQGEWR